MSVSSFAPFSLDDPERIGCQECLLSDPALVGCKSDRYYVLRSTAAPQSVALRARHCSGVDSGDMLVSPWVLDCLHLTPGGSIDVSLFNNATELPPEAAIDLRLERALSSLHWDEYDQTPSSYFGGAVWSPHRPAGVSVEEVMATVRAAWPTRPFFATGGLVAADVGCHTMVFSVRHTCDTSAGDGMVTVCLNPSALRLVADSDAAPASEETATAEEVDNGDTHSSWMLSDDGMLSCQREAYLAAAAMLSGPPPLHRSLLIEGPSGAGLSWMLARIAIAAHRGCSVQRKSCVVVISRTAIANAYSSFTFSRVSLQRAVAATPQFRSDIVVSKLISFLYQIDANDIHSSNAAIIEKLLSGSYDATLEPNLHLLVLIDRLEQWVLDEDDAEQESAMGVALRDLLGVLSSSRSELVDLNIVGSCSDIRAAPLRRLSRPPGFDLMRQLHVPTDQDRYTLIETHLSDLSCRLCSDIEEDLVKGMAAISVESFCLPESNCHQYVLKLVKLTAGYLPKDLVLLLERARRYQLGIHDRRDSTEIEWRYVLKALAATPPSRLQSVLSYSFVENIGTSRVSADGEKRPLTWEDFGGYADIKLRLKLLMEKLHESKEQYDGTTSKLVTSMDKPKGIVLTGKPGCGKSYLVQVLASEAKMNFLSVNSTLLLSMYFGETEENIRKLFAGARSVSPCVLFFDEFEVISKKRTANGDSSSCTDGGVGSRVLSTFLNELDGISSDSNCPVLVIVACSDVTSLDAAIVRPGRLQHHFELRALTEDDMGSIVEIQLSSYPHRCCDGMDSKDIVSAVIATNAHYSQFSRVASISPAVLVTICSNALLLAVKETIVEDGCNKMNASIQVSKRHIESAIQEYFFKLS